MQRAGLNAVKHDRLRVPQLDDHVLGGRRRRIDVLHLVRRDREGDVDPGPRVAAVEPDAVGPCAERSDEVIRDPASLPGHAFDEQVHGFTIAPTCPGHIRAAAELFAEIPQLPGLGALRALRLADAHACVDCDAAARQPEHGVEVELCDLGDVVGEAGEPKNQIDQRLRVGGRLPPEAGDELPGLAGKDELLGVVERERRDPELRLTDQLGEDAAGAKRDERAEDRILDDTGEELGAAADERLDEHRAA